MDAIGKGIVMERWDVGGRVARAGALLAVAVLCAGAAFAAAEVRVTALGAGRLTVAAHDATVRQVLDALSESSPMRLHTSDALSRVVTGTYSGTLRQVLARILDGYDHVVQSTASGLRLDVVGATTGTPGGSFADPVAISAAPHLGARVSTNVDLDEEMAQRAAAAQQPMRAAAPPPVTATLAGAPHPGFSKISTNVDLDEEMARGAAAPQPVKTAAPSIRPVPAVITGGVQRPAVPSISTNVDLDEATSR